MSKLTPEQQEAAWLHCEYVSLPEGVLWLKSQFNLTTSRSALSNWLRRRRAKNSLDACFNRLLDTREQALLIGKLFRSATKITVANSVLISQAAFEELQKKSEDRDDAKISTLMRLALQAKEQEIKEKVVALQAHRLQFDAAKVVHRKFKELKDIDDGDGDEATKIEKVMLLLFGERPDVTDFSEVGPDLPEKEPLT